MSVAAWWRERADRERHLLCFSAVVLLLVMFFLFVHEPLFGRLERAERMLRSELVTLDALHGSAREARRLGSREDVAVRLPDGQSAVAFINETASAAGLDGYLRRIAPRGDTLSVVLERAPFDAVSLWLANLAGKHNLHVSRLSVEHIEAAPGAVNAKLTFVTQ